MKRFIKLELPPDTVKKIFKECTGLDYLLWDEHFTVECVFLNHYGEMEFHFQDTLERRENIKMMNDE